MDREKRAIEIYKQMRLGDKDVMPFNQIKSDSVKESYCRIADLFIAELEKANKERLKVLSSVKLINEWTANYTKIYPCYLDFLEWVTDKQILN